LSLPPTLDHAGWEIPASSAAQLVGGRSSSETALQVHQARRLA
jgi:hypothetical protein